MRFESNLREVQAELRHRRERATEAIGLYVEGEAKLLTPVDTGNLRSSISHKSDDEKAVIGTNTDYSEFVEKGTSRQKAQPFLTPAAENNKDKITQLARRYLGD